MDSCPIIFDAPFLALDLNVNVTLQHLNWFKRIRACPAIVRGFLVVARVVSEDLKTHTPTGHQCVQAAIVTDDDGSIKFKLSVKQYSRNYRRSLQDYEVEVQGAGRMVKLEVQCLVRVRFLLSCYWKSRSS